MCVEVQLPVLDGAEQEGRGRGENDGVTVD